MQTQPKFKFTPWGWIAVIYTIVGIIAMIISHLGEYPAGKAILIAFLSCQVICTGIAFISWFYVFDWKKRAVILAFFLFLGNTIDFFNPLWIPLVENANNIYKLISNLRLTIIIVSILIIGLKTLPVKTKK